MAECLAMIHLCRVRVTRLDQFGNPTAGPNNVYVTDTPMVLTVTPNYEAGQDLVLTGGCDCIIAEYRGFDKLKRFDLELDIGTFEPGLIEMMIGAAAIVDSGAPIGVWWPTSQFDCGVPAQPNVCIEAWQDAWDEDQQSSVFPFIQHIFPSSFWSIGATTLQNDFTQPKLTGFTRQNTNWGLGIYGDQPETAQPLGGSFYTTTRPDGSCGYQSHAIT